METPPSTIYRSLVADRHTRQRLSHLMHFDAFRKKALKWATTLSSRSSPGPAAYATWTSEEERELCLLVADCSGKSHRMGSNTLLPCSPVEFALLIHTQLLPQIGDGTESFVQQLAFVQEVEGRVRINWKINIQQTVRKTCFKSC